ncbi:PH domain-containing protein [Micromonospora sp. RL09-050-HVF-A]|uniref:PH domain-containing protein n=1 Tax=Micromonospora sp. RL09-050-HVF-A TaxID=1703433 RepID=UPI001C5D9512|nr:PH domain-containing protein [Micromonospora sp. RL09-050-HVF-A]MBW4703819.1 PH domain-containing protein [Micromonospora sp. RL09-050-HVF-A]
MHPPSSPARQWRVPPALPAVKLVGAVGLVALGLLLAAGDPVPLALAVAATVGLAAWAVRDLLAPVRLAVDAEGITVVRGYAGRRHLPWGVVEAVTVDRRTRFGLTGETLEIDAGETLHLLGRADLGAWPTEVAEVVRAARP